MRYWIPALFFSTVVVLFCCRGRYKKNRIAGTLFVSYVLVVLQTAFFSREPGSRKTISLVPFETWGCTFHMHAFFIENIIMFLPFGVLMPILFPRMRRFSCCVLAGFACSCAIEIAQYLTQRGFLQLDDIMTNTAGTLVGWFIWKVSVRFMIT